MMRKGQWSNKKVGVSGSRVISKRGLFEFKKNLSFDQFKDGSGPLGLLQLLAMGFLFLLHFFSSKYCSPNHVYAYLNP